MCSLFCPEREAAGLFCRGAHPALCPELLQTASTQKWYSTWSLENCSGMHTGNAHRNVRSLKECYYGYYPKNPSKPVAPACPCRYLTLSAAHMAPLQCQHFLLLPCSLCQAKEKQQRLVLFLGRNGSCRSQWAVHAHTGSSSAQWGNLCKHVPGAAFSMKASHRTCVGPVCGTGAWQGLRRILSVAAEPGRLRCVSCPQPPIVPGKVVTSSSLNLSPYFVLPSWW